VGRQKVTFQESASIRLHFVLVPVHGAAKLSQSQFAVNGSGRTFQGFSPLVIGETAKKKKLNEIALALILRG
jgi:hypothetical protein